VFRTRWTDVGISGFLEPQFRTHSPGYSFLLQERVLGYLLQLLLLAGLSAAYFSFAILCWVGTFGTKQFYLGSLWKPTQHRHGGWLPRI
jgi:hypothetical protein